MFRISQHSPESAYLGTISRDISYTELMANCVGNPPVEWGFIAVLPWCVLILVCSRGIQESCSWELVGELCGPQLLCSISGWLCRCKGLAEIILQYAWILRIWFEDMTCQSMWWSFTFLNMSRFIEIYLAYDLWYCMSYFIIFSCIFYRLMCNIDTQDIA